MAAALTPPYYTGSSIQASFYNDEESMLKESMMGRSLELSPASSRRESASSDPMYSPKQEGTWATDIQSIPTSTSVSMPSSQQTAFFSPDMTAQQTLMGSAGTNWSSLSSSATIGVGMGVGMGVGVDSMSLGQQFEPMDGFDFSQQQMLQANPTFGMNTALFPGMMPSGPVAGAAGNLNIPVNTMDGIAAITNGSKRSPMAQAVLHELRRGDGIRKKNARFDIPAERNLTNIDHLIAQSTDEQEIKELKQQKRLLRNRQAALDSRQRKKMHTERLEVEKKQFTSIISDMEEEMAMLRKEIERVSLENHRLQEYAQVQTMEKENLIREHTLATGDLRKQANVLRDRVHCLETENLDLRSGRGTGFNGLDGCYSPDTPHQTPSPPTTGWDASAGSGFLDSGFGGNAKHVKAEPASPHSMHAQKLVSMNQTGLSEDASVERSGVSENGQNSLLFMLFLVGAYVISTGSASAAAPVLPAISEDMRATTVGLLQNIFKNAGVDTAASATTSTVATSSWAMPTSSNASMIGTLGDMLTLPTNEQTNEHTFGLSAVQYNDANIMVALDSTQQKASSQRNLAGTLNILRGSGNVADVCSRSLLREQIPADVVRNFARMVGHGASGCSSANLAMASAKA
ncbi:hypothetical protein TD95_003180 [Thielaviopsis punctulata]|uniref:BZIP domain-containing protein n=1 Tax=Thielaviopsis punctulata TaxID=72032 RepID=A0A0F4ZBM8_9PEZI|nr:hypothetical protein TD95_003180 [Thielaviopsis punctulata]